MNTEIELILSKHSEKTVELFLRLRDIIYEAAEVEPREILWARLPSYCVGDSFVRLIPFSDHINIEARAIADHKSELQGHKLTPKGMLQIFVGRDIPVSVLKVIFNETLR